MNILSFIGTEYENLNFSTLLEEEIIKKIQKMKKIDYNILRYLFVNSYLFHYNKLLDYLKTNYNKEYKNINKKYINLKIYFMEEDLNVK